MSSGANSGVKIWNVRSLSASKKILIVVRTHRRACAEPARLDFDDPSFVRNHLGRCLRPILLPFVAIFCRMILQQVKVMMNDDLFGSNTHSLSLSTRIKGWLCSSFLGRFPPSLRVEKAQKRGEGGVSARVYLGRYNLPPPRGSNARVKIQSDRRGVGGGGGLFRGIAALLLNFSISSRRGPS